MSEKKIYESPEMEIVILSMDDIVTTSMCPTDTGGCTGIDLPII